MMRIISIALIPLLAQAGLLRSHAAPQAASPLTAKVDNKQVQLSAAKVEAKKLMHFGCVSACEPSPIESKCATACEAEAYRCIDETGPNETPEDTKKCTDKVIANYQKTKGLPAKKEGNATKGNATKAPEEKKKAKMFLQVKNIDDDNAEAAEMARLEAQSDKDMGEDDDETKSDDDEEKSDDEESFVQTSSKKGDGFDGFGTPDPFNQNDDDQVDAGEPNAPDQENPNDDANMVSDDDADDDDSFIQTSRNIDDDNAEAAEMARLEAQSDKDMGEDDDETKSDDDEEKSDDEESFVQTSSKKGDGFDGFGTPDPFNQNDDDQVDAGEPNAPDQENPNDDANMVSDDDADDDDSFIQTSRNIDDDNAEAAEMARLEAQSDKDMGEDDDETSKGDSEDKSDDEE